VVAGEAETEVEITETKIIEIDETMVVEHETEVGISTATAEMEGVARIEEVAVIEEVEAETGERGSSSACEADRGQGMSERRGEAQPRRSLEVAMHCLQGPCRKSVEIAILHHLARPSCYHRGIVELTARGNQRSTRTHVRNRRASLQRELPTNWTRGLLSSHRDLEKSSHGSGEISRRSSKVSRETRTRLKQQRRATPEVTWRTTLMKWPLKRLRRQQRRCLLQKIFNAAWMTSQGRMRSLLQKLFNAAWIT